MTNPKDEAKHDDIKAVPAVSNEEKKADAKAHADKKAKEDADRKASEKTKVADEAVKEEATPKKVPPLEEVKEKTVKHDGDGTSRASWRSRPTTRSTPWSR